MPAAAVSSHLPTYSAEDIRRPRRLDPLFLRGFRVAVAAGISFSPCARASPCAGRIDPRLLQQETNPQRTYEDHPLEIPSRPARHAPRLDHRLERSGAQLVPVSPGVHPPKTPLSVGHRVAGRALDGICTGYPASNRERKVTRCERCSKSSSTAWPRVGCNQPPKLWKHFVS